MNEVLKTIKERRSVRSFKKDMPSKEDIDSIVEAGLYAPSAVGRQAVISLVITKKELRDEIAEDNRKIGGWQEGFDPFYGAPVIIMVLAKKDFACRVYDGSVVMENMMLAAKSLGIDSIWIHRAKEESEMPKYKELLKSLGVEGEWEGIGHCAIGYRNCNEPEAAPRKSGRVYYVD